MFRIVCKFEPRYLRANGGDCQGPLPGRGAWRVVACYETRSTTPVRLLHPMPVGKTLAVLCPTSRKDGTRCSPRKLLDEYLDHRRLVRAVNVLGAPEIFSRA